MKLLEEIVIIVEIVTFINCKTSLKKSTSFEKLVKKFWFRHCSLKVIYYKNINISMRKKLSFSVTFEKTEVYLEYSITFI